uniref:Uncharacterized protein LOC114339320 n=1 Tax=Diabrotica virgifera virgifera TaxID=50390 RepID=A0A6P7G973_DIAVI
MDIKKLLFLINNMHRKADLPDLTVPEVPEYLTELIRDMLKLRSKFLRHRFNGVTREDLAQQFLRLYHAICFGIRDFKVELKHKINNTTRHPEDRDEFVNYLQHLLHKNNNYIRAHEITEDSYFWDKYCYNQWPVQRLFLALERRCLMMADTREEGRREFSRIVRSHLYMGICYTTTRHSS